MVIIQIKTFVDVGAVSFPVDLSSVLLIITVIRLTLLGSFLCCFKFSAVDSLSRGLGGSGSRTFAGS
jgi:hypothetical protein